MDDGAVNERITFGGYEPEKNAIKGDRGDWHRFAYESCQRSMASVAIDSQHSAACSKRPPHP